MTFNYQSFSKAIKDKQKTKRKYSLAEMASDANVSYTSMRSAWNGIEIKDIDVILNIIAWLDKPVMEFVKTN